MCPGERDCTVEEVQKKIPSPRRGVKGWCGSKHASAGAACGVEGNHVLRLRKGVEGLSPPGAVAVGRLKGDFEHCTVEKGQRKIPSPQKGVKGLRNGVDQ